MISLGWKGRCGMVTYPKAFLVLGAAVLAACGAAALPVPEAHAATTTLIAGGAILAQQCRDGQVVVSGHGILTCTGGRWIYRDCPTGTAPRAVGADHVICEHT
jgi:hypothetical protein